MQRKENENWTEAASYGSHFSLVHSGATRIQQAPGGSRGIPGLPPGAFWEQRASLKCEPYKKFVGERIQTGVPVPREPPRGQ